VRGTQSRLPGSTHTPHPWPAPSLAHSHQPLSHGVPYIGASGHKWGVVRAQGSGVKGYWGRGRPLGPPAAHAHTPRPTHQRPGRTHTQLTTSTRQDARGRHGVEQGAAPRSQRQRSRRDTRRQRGHALQLRWRNTSGRRKPLPRICPMPHDARKHKHPGEAALRPTNNGIPAGRG
jgi:hypothetical protein